MMAVFLSQFVSEEVARHVAAGDGPHGRVRARSPRRADEGRLRRSAGVARGESAARRDDRAGRRSHRSPARRWPASSTSGIGSDLDGGGPVADGLEDVSRFPYLIAELLGRGYSDDEVRGIAGGNVLRVMRGAEAVASRLQAERPPSEATIEELDGGSPRR